MTIKNSTALLREYKETERLFFEHISTRLKGTLLLYCVTGSLASDDIVPGWSDIDIFMVIDSYTQEVFQSIDSALATNQTNTKIGVTVLSVAEMQHSFLKPSRLYDVINLIHHGVYTPRIHEASLLLEEQSEAHIRNANRSEFGFFLQFLKKGLAGSPESFNEYDTYKNLTILLKILLREQSIQARSYSDIQANLHLVPGLTIAFPLPQDIILGTEGKAARYASYLAFLEWLQKNAHALFR